VSKFNQLFSLLNKEFAVQQELQKVLEKEHQAIQKFDQEKIELTTQHKNKLLTAAKLNESKRRELIKGILGVETLRESPTLEQLLERCEDAPLKRNILFLRDKLKETAINVKVWNDANRMLLKESVALVSTTASLFQSVPHQAVSTYSPRGKVSDKDGKGKVYGRTRGRV